MRYLSILLIVHACLGILQSHAQSVTLDRYEFTAINAHVSTELMEGMKVIRVLKDTSVKEFDEPTFARITDSGSENGIINVKVLSRLLPDAPDFARGFIGVAFRINESNTKYESVYLRPINARVSDQIRRNHSLQYYSYPDYKFDVLRRISPEKYESYADLEMNTWIDLRIEVMGDEARLFINQNKQPALVITDLKHGADVSGAVALWVETGTEGFFRSVSITKIK